jgi:putative transcriptional regulator
MMPDKELAISECLTGSLLISAPTTNSHPLEECVVFIYEHSPQTGAQGVVINRKSRLTVGFLLERMKLTPTTSSLNSPLYHGGLVDENGIIMLHSSEWHSSNTRAISREVCISSDTAMLEKIVTGNEPDNWIMCAGKLEWEPGVLTQEVNKNQWLTVPAHNGIVFSALTEANQWRAALNYCTRCAVDSWF